MMMRGLGGVNEDMIETPPVITATVRLQSCNASLNTLNGACKFLRRYSKEDSGEFVVL